MTRSRDLSNSQANLGVAIPPVAAGKNAVINGGMDIWQRGTSVAIANSSTNYTADRWAGISVNTGTVTRQATGDTTNLPNIQYCARIQRTAATTGTNGMYFYQSFETINSIPFAGKPITFSFYARKGANFSATAVSAKVWSGTGTDQNIISGYTGAVDVTNSSSFVPTTTWTRYTFTGTVPTTATELAPGVEWVTTGTAGAADYLEITGIQLEAGSVATPFGRNGTTYQGELAACQRYYYRANWDAKAAYPVFAQGGGYSSTSARLTMPLPVNMRVQPTAIDTSAVANLRVQSFNDGTSVAPSAITFDTNFTTTTNGFINATVASGLTANALYYLRGEGSTAYYIGWSAEL